MPPIEIRAVQGNAWVFVAFPDMRLCEALLLTACYRFDDGRVVAQLPLLTPLNLLLGTLRIPLGGCTRIPTMGGSPRLVEVYTNLSDTLAVGEGTCADLARRVADHTAYLVIPGVRTVIPPMDASVGDLAALRP